MLKKKVQNVSPHSCRAPLRFWLQDWYLCSLFYCDKIIIIPSIYFSCPRSVWWHHSAFEPPDKPASVCQYCGELLTFLFCFQHLKIEHKGADRLPVTGTKPWTVFDILILWFIKIHLWPASLPALTFHLVASYWNHLWASFRWRALLKAPSTLLKAKVHLNRPRPTFRPLRCWRWPVAGSSRTAWRCLCCSSPRVQWSSSTRRPGSRWCWTGTWRPVWRGWSRSWRRSAESLLGAPDHGDRESRHHLAAVRARRSYNRSRRHFLTTTAWVLPLILQ